MSNKETSDKWDVLCGLNKSAYKIDFIKKNCPTKHFQYYFVSNDTLYSWYDNVSFNYTYVTNIPRLLAEFNNVIFLGLFKKMSRGMISGYMKDYPQFKKYVHVKALSEYNDNAYFYFVEKEDYLINHTEEDYEKALTVSQKRLKRIAAWKEKKCWI